MSNKDTSVNVGCSPGFLGMLTILFIALKLTDHIDWSWWWVVSPLWIPLAVVFGGFAVVGLFVLLMMGIVMIFER